MRRTAVAIRSIFLATISRLAGLSKARTSLTFIVSMLAVLLPASMIIFAPKLRSALQTTITVNSIADPSDGANCTLREAINNANAESDTSGGNCNFGIGPQTIIFSVGGQITLSSALPAITNASESVKIDGGGTISLNGASSFQVMSVASMAHVTLNALTILNGDTTGNGGGVDNFGTLTVTNCTIHSNSAIPNGPGGGGTGGGIDNELGGSLTVKNSTFADNTSLQGGGIGSEGTTLIVTNSTFLRNSGTGGGPIVANGGGIRTESGTATITNSTFSQNSSPSGLGGAISVAGGAATVESCTLFDNSAGGGGAIVRVSPSGTATVTNSILANSGGGNCGLGISGGTNSGYNIADDSSCMFGNSMAANGDTIGDNISALDLNIALGLANNGGPTQTYAINSPSFAIEAIPAANCPATDQRAAPRPASGSDCTVGAFEFGGVVPSPTPTPTATATAASTATATATSTNTAIATATSTATATATPTATGTATATATATDTATATATATDTATATASATDTATATATTTDTATATATTTLTATATATDTTTATPTATATPTTTVTATATESATATDTATATATDTATATSTATTTVTATPTSTATPAFTFKLTVTPYTQNYNVSTLGNVGTTTPPRTSTATNFSGAPINIGQATVATDMMAGPSPNFMIASDNCSNTTLAANASCTITTTFTSTAAGTTMGTLTVPSNALNSPNITKFAGNAVQASINLSTTVVFPNTQVGSTSGAATSTMTNNNPVGVTISMVATSGPFAIAHDGCTGVLAANSSCTVTTTFSPTMRDAATGSLTFTSNARNSPASIKLQGSGTLTAPVLTPSNVFFGNVPRNTTSPDMFLTLTNNNPAIAGGAISIDSITTGNPLYEVDAVMTTCGASLDGGSSCIIAVNFTPTATGNVTSSLSVIDNAGTGLQRSSLFGSGT